MANCQWLMMGIAGGRAVGALADSSRALGAFRRRRACARRTSIAKRSVQTDLRRLRSESPSSLGEGCAADEGMGQSISERQRANWVTSSGEVWG